MTIVTLDKPGPGEAVSDPLGNAVKYSEAALHSNNVPAALKVLNDYVARAKRISEGNKDKLDAQISRIEKKAGLNDILQSECHIARGKLFQKAHDLGGAIKEFKAALKLAPKNGCIPLYLGNNYETILRHKEAVSFYKQTLKIKGEAHSKNNDLCAKQAGKQLLNLADFLARKLQTIGESVKNGPQPAGTDR